jgi:ubiquinone/menaquinone biosynthesis C-methylase UbiE
LVSQLKRGDYVFDAGCGDGYALDLFRAAGLRYAGGDVNEVKLREARRHGHENVKRVDLHNLDLPSNSLEAIHCSHVLEHLLDAPKVIKEFARLLKPGGYAMVVVPLGPSNRKHPTAFIAADDLIELVSPYFCIITGGEESARGGKELWVLLQVLKETLPAQISNGATDSSAPERKLASTS